MTLNPPRNRRPGPPWWATMLERPDPGVTEYHHPVGTVSGRESREELRIELVRRDADGRRGEAMLSVGGTRLDTHETLALVRVLRRGLVLMNRGAR